MESELSILVSLTMHLGLYAIKILYISFALWHGIAKMAMVQSQWGRFINKKRVKNNKNRGERQKNSENQVTLDSVFGASKKHYLSNFVLYML
jgi:hypothetical protein